MKAAVLTQLNAPLEICEVEPILPLSYGQVLVRVLAAGICGAQLQEIRGEKGGPLPHLMGHEGCGLVEAIGPGVKRVKPGDKVVMHWRKAAGIESEFPRYRFNGSKPTALSLKPTADHEFTSGLVTTWAEQTICSENRLTPVPADTDPVTATLLGCSLSTAMATVESEARWGERVLVIGCGGLGLALIAALDMVEPRQLCACDIHEEKRFSAETSGADFINLQNGAPLTGEYDLILDTAGAPSAAETAIERLAPSGRYVMIGQPAPGKPICINSARHLFDGDGKTIKATQGGGFRPDLDLPRYIKIAECMRLWPLISHRYALADINAALDRVRAGEAGRVLIEFPNADCQMPIAENRQSEIANRP